MRTEDQIRVRLLGSLAIQGVPGEVKLPSKAWAVIAYVFGVSNGIAMRSDLARLIWPDVPPSRAKHSLSQALYVINRAAGSNVLASARHSIAIGTAVSDLSEFNRACEQCEWLRAAQLFQGGYADTLYVDKAFEFDTWLSGKRAEIHRRGRLVLRRLMLDSRSATQVAVLSEVLLAHDPLNPELVAARTASLLETRGLREAKSFAAALGGPARETAETLLRKQTRGEGKAQDTVFVGRDDAIGWLEDRFEEAATYGTATFAAVEGEAGIGKTVLLSRFARLMVLRGARVLSAAAFEAEKNLPMGIVGQWLHDAPEQTLASVREEPWFDVVESSFPDVADGTEMRVADRPSEIGHQRLLESVRRFFVHLSENKPLVLCLDDIQWADPTSLSFAHYLFRRSPSTRILVVATMRIAGTDPDPVRNWPGARSLSLKGLLRNDIVELLERHRADGRPNGHASVDYLIQRTGGNPLLLSMLLQEGDPGQGDVSSPPQSIIEFFRPRLLQRSPLARRLVAALAVLEEPSDIDVAASVAGLERVEVHQAIDQLVQSKLITFAADDKLELRHGLVGEVALSMAPIAEKQQLRGRAARLMAGRDQRRSPFVALSHDVAGNREDAFRASMKASRACDVLYARSEMEFFLKIALNNAPTLRDEAEVRIELATLHLVQDQPREAIEVLDLPSFPPSPLEVRRRAELTRLRALAEMTGDEESLAKLWREAKAVGGEAPPAVRADTYARFVATAYDLGLHELAAEAADEARAGLSALPLTVETARRLLRPIGAIALLKGVDAALKEIGRLPSPDEGGPNYRVSMLTIKATVLVAAGRHGDAEDLFATALGITERYALFDFFHTIHNNLGVCLMEQGRFDEAEHHLATADESAADSSPSRQATAKNNLTILDFERAEFTRALEHGAHLLKDRAVSGSRAAMGIGAIVGLCSLESGELRRCREVERDLRIMTNRHGYYGGDMSYTYIFLARMAALRGEVADALKTLAEAADAYNGRNNPARWRLELERCRLVTKQGVDCGADLERVLEEMRGSGAVPLIDRAEGLLARQRE